MPDEQIPLTFQEFFEKYCIEFTNEEMKARNPSIDSLVEFCYTSYIKNFKVVKSHKCKF